MTISITFLTFIFLVGEGAHKKADFVRKNIKNLDVRNEVS